MQTVIKEKFRTLNQTIQALHEVQSAWIVPDSMLRRNLKDAIAEDFLPFYLAFFNRYKVLQVLVPLGVCPAELDVCFPSFFLGLALQNPQCCRLI